MDRIHDLEDENARLREQLGSVLDSSSWRLTRPLRRLRGSARPEAVPPPAEPRPIRSDTTPEPPARRTRAARGPGSLRGGALLLPAGGSRRSCCSSRATHRSGRPSRGRRPGWTGGSASRSRSVARCSRGRSVWSSARGQRRRQRVPRPERPVPAARRVAARGDAALAAAAADDRGRFRLLVSRNRSRQP